MPSQLSNHNAVVRTLGKVLSRLLRAPARTLANLLVVLLLLLLLLLPEKGERASGARISQLAGAGHVRHANPRVHLFVCADLWLGGDCHRRACGLPPDSEGFRHFFYGVAVFGTTRTLVGKAST